MTITWEAIAAITAVVGAVIAGLLWLVRQIVNAALLDFEHRFFDKLNGRYIKREFCEERHRDLVERVKAVERAEA